MPLAACLSACLRGPGDQGHPERQDTGAARCTSVADSSNKTPRKAQTVLYLTGGLDNYEDLLARLGPY